MRRLKNIFASFTFSAVRLDFGNPPQPSASLSIFIWIRRAEITHLIQLGNKYYSIIFEHKQIRHT